MVWKAVTRRELNQFGDLDCHQNGCWPRHDSVGAILCWATSQTIPSCLGWPIRSNTCVSINRAARGALSRNEALREFPESDAYDERDLGPHIYNLA